MRAAPGTEVLQVAQADPDIEVPQAGLGAEELQVVRADPDIEVPQADPGAEALQADHRELAETGVAAYKGFERADPGTGVPPEQQAVKAADIQVVKALSFLLPERSPLPYSLLLFFRPVQPVRGQVRFLFLRCQAF